MAGFHFTHRKGVRKYGREPERFPAWIGWLGLFLYVAGWDLCPNTVTLSTGFAPCKDATKPLGGWRASHGHWYSNVVAFYIMGHLTRFLPVKYDILRSPNSPLVRWQRNATRVGKTL